ncbi:MAG: hypothetical protein NZZ41_05575 [Candidatus Dojkabacteria bacterium]|nr:hypothetical protein [Candidatus Dojkabacteria bacterium]
MSILTYEEIEKNNITARKEIIDDVRLLLGQNLIDVELDPEHYEVCLKKSFEKYRQRSSNSVEESYYFMELQPNQYIYYLPTEIIEVRSLFRRGVSGGISGGAYIDPFSMAYTNAYLLNLSSGSVGSPATYDFFMGYVEMIGRLFGRDINFTWEPALHKMTIMRKITGKEQIIVWCYIYKPDFLILRDPYAKSWIRDYTLANCKFLLGEARSKFSNIPGPQGGSQLNGSEMKQEAKEMMEKLEDELFKNVEQRMGYGFLIG